MITAEELEMFVDYLVYHTNEDWPLDQSMKDFKEKVKKWSEQKNENVE